MLSRCSDNVPLDPKRKVACKLCCLRELCAPESIDPAQLDLLEVLVERQRIRLKPGEHLYQAGDPFTVLFAVHTGSLKTYVVTDEGRERVEGFHISGDLLGMDAISMERHTCSAVALENSGVCVVPFERLEELARSQPFLQRQFHRIMSRELKRDQGIMMLLAQMSAEARLAAFLLDLSQRFAARGFPADHFRLPMGRPDIGAYLGLKPETVSRIFSKFQAKGIIAKRGKDLRITNPEGLRGLLGLGDEIYAEQIP